MTMNRLMTVAQLPVPENGYNQRLEVFQVCIGIKIFPLNNSMFLLFQKILA